MIRQVRFRLPLLAIVFIAAVWTVRAAYSETESNTACAPLPAGLVSWWPGEGNANDEVDVFNRGLSGSEIQAIYNAGGAGKCGSQGFTGVYIPFVVKPAKPPAKILQNGNFEAGPVDWGQLSSNGWQLILKASNLLVSPYIITPFHRNIVIKRSM